MAILQRLSADLGSGRAESVLVHGEAGIGKTTLLAGLLDVVADGFTVLRAARVQSEAEIAFAGLADLIAPVLEHLADLPAPQAAALAGAVAVGPPQPGDRLAVCVATLGLLRAAGERHPVLAIVDDLQWLDLPSRECVQFAARRASGKVAFVMAARDEPDSPLNLAALPTLALHRLDRASSLKLLQRRAPDLSERVAEVLTEAADGNPLALVELPGTLSAGERTGACELVVPPSPGMRWGSVYATSAAALPESSRRALLLAALYRGDDLETLATACAHAGTQASGLDDAEDHGLLCVDYGRVSFRHPLIRGIIADAATGSELRRAHGALARALGGEARVWHLGASVIGPDEGIAAELEQAALDAARRRGFASAVSALERAARLSSRAADRARRMLGAGQTAAAAGMPARATALLDEALTAPVPAVARAEIQHARGALLLWTGDVENAGVLLRDEAERIAQQDPVRAATMLADAATAGVASNDVLDAERLARRAAAVLADHGDSLARAHVCAVLGWVLALRGQGVQATAVLREADRHAAGLDPLIPGRPWLHFPMRARIPLGELGTALSEGVALCDRARDAGAMSVLASSLVITADAAFRVGDWSLAERSAAEAVAVARESNQQIWHGYALVIGASIHAARGEEGRSRRAADAAFEIASSGPVRAGLRFAHGVRGFLDLTFERIPAAITALEEVERLVTESGLDEPTLVPWPSDLVEAYLRAGRHDQAHRVLADLTLRAAEGPVTARMLLHRCRGLLAADFDDEFAAALACDEDCPMAFERARTLLAYGRRLHRARRRRESRVRLREALDLFETLGAAPWAEQTRRELAAAGARRRAPAKDSDTLSAQERRVAEVVSRGATNKQAAAELFLSPKTVEFHLDHVYRKLGIHSRMALPAALDSQAGRDPGAASVPGP